VNSLIIDEDGIYDPRLINDRLLLGMKGTFSELELSTLRQRSHEALRLKAVRGDLHTVVAIGYRRGADDRLEQDPDRRIRETLSLVFRKFREIRSVHHASGEMDEAGKSNIADFVAHVRPAISAL
jgi:DNA invertase Pin-like site-specific DNA recombinase